MVAGLVRRLRRRVVPTSTQALPWLPAPALTRLPGRRCRVGAVGQPHAEGPAAVGTVRLRRRPARNQARVPRRAARSRDGAVDLVARRPPRPDPGVHDAGQHRAASLRTVSSNSYGPGPRPCPASTRPACRSGSYRANRGAIRSITAVTRPPPIRVYAMSRGDRGIFSCLHKLRTMPRSPPLPAQTRPTTQVELRLQY